MTSARPQTCTSHHYSDHIHDFIPCIILSSRCATFITRDCFREMTRSRASHQHVSYTCLGLGFVGNLPPTILALNPHQSATPLTPHQKLTKSQIAQLR